MKKLLLFTITIINVHALCSSCTDSFLDIKPDKKLVVPETLEDVQALLDNTLRMNQGYPATQEVTSDDYFLPDENYNAVFSLTTRNAYIWDSNLFNDSDRNDWANLYVTVFYANVVLEVLDSYEPSEQEKMTWNNLKGQALFFRSFAFYNLLQLFAKTYDSDSSSSDLGIVLKLDSDIDHIPQRSSVKDSYNRVIEDLMISKELLPQLADHKTRPSGLAVDALLARVYLSMSDFDEALWFSAACIEQHGRLMDYNDINQATSRPFQRFNDEVIFHSTLFGQPLSLTRVSPELYALYDEDDLRRQIFFLQVRNSDYFNYRGSYDGGSTFFGGLAMDEIYLINAECHARVGDLSIAIDILNTLLEKRWSNTVEYPKVVVADKESVLQKVILERRKQLVFRGLRWSDLRRLNMDNEYATVLTRVVNGKTYELLPQSNSYVFRIPDIVIRNNGIEQND